MTLALTGRSVLKFLHAHGGETSLATLASTLSADPAGIERLILSLLAANLVYRTTDLLGLSEAGKAWCEEEFKPNADGLPTLAGITPEESMEAPVRSEWPSGGQSLMPRKTNRMQGVQVVRVARRREQVVSCSPPPAIASESSPASGQDSEWTPPAAVVGETADPVPVPVVPPSESRPTESVAPRIVVDKAGFVTHIKGRRIY